MEVEDGIHADFDDGEDYGGLGGGKVWVPRGSGISPGGSTRSGMVRSDFGDLVGGVQHVRTNGAVTEGPVRGG